MMDNLTILQNVVQNATGSFLSTHNGVPALSDNFAYPLNINTSYLDATYDSCESSFQPYRVDVETLVA